MKLFNFSFVLLLVLGVMIALCSGQDAEDTTGGPGRGPPPGCHGNHGNRGHHGRGRHGRPPGEGPPDEATEATA